MSFDQHNGLYVVTDGAERASPSEIYAFGSMGNPDSSYHFNHYYYAGEFEIDPDTGSKFIYHEGGSTEPVNIYQYIYFMDDGELIRPIEYLDFSSLRGGSGGVIHFTSSESATIIGSHSDDEIYYWSDAGGLLIGNGGADIITGGSGNDELRGGNGNDELRGGNGRDRLVGGEGHDELRGDNGNDRLFGEDGNDTLFGGEGHDELRGGNGGDKLVGGNGDDELRGGDDNDTLFGGNGLDKLIGGDGNDKLFGGDNNDTLFGGNGHDEIRGGAGDDRLFGGSGDDTLYGGNGDDEIRGGIGNDEFIFADGDGDDTIFGFGRSDDEVINLSGVSSITGFVDLMNNHLVNSGGDAMIVYGPNSILLSGVNFNDVGYGLDYSASDFVF